MALHNQISDANKVQTVGRVTRYTATPVTWSGGDNVTRTLAWTITRISSMAYQHIALTREAAEAGAAELTRQLTRRYEAWTHELDESTNPPTPVISRGYTIDCTSTVTPSQASGDAWIVDVGIEDTDTVITTDEPTPENIAELFALASQREAEETHTANLYISSDSYWDSVSGIINVFWQASNIENFDPALITVERKQGDNWVAADVVAGSLGAGGCQIVSGQNLGFRVNYNDGAVISNYYVTNDEPMPVINLLDGEYNFANASISGQIPLAVRFIASGAASALASVTNVRRWEVTVTGTSNTANAYLNRAVPRSITDDGDGYYTMRLWTDSAPVGTAENLIVSAKFLAKSDAAVSSAATATLRLTDYIVVMDAHVIQQSPSQTRVRFALRSDVNDFILRRATWSVVGEYSFGPSIQPGRSVGTVVRIENTTSSNDLSLVVSFSDLRYMPSPYGVAVSLSCSDATTGKTIATPRPYTVTVDMPNIWITSASLAEAEGMASTIAYTFAIAGAFDWAGDMAQFRYWLSVGGRWGGLQPSLGSTISDTDFVLYFTESVHDDYMQIATSLGGESSVYIPSDARYLKIIEATYDASEQLVTILYDRQLTDFDASALRVGDVTADTELTCTVSGDIVTVSLAADGTSHDLRLVYTGDAANPYASNAVTVVAE